MDDRVTTVVRLTPDRHQWLREQAYRRGITQQQVMEEAIDLLRAGTPADPGPPTPGPTQRRVGTAEHRPGRLFKEPK